LEMLQLAVKKQPGFIVDTREIGRPGASFMVDTLVSLSHENPQHPLLLIIGSDAFNQLTSWHQWQRLFDFAHIVVLTRPGFTAQQFDGFFAVRHTTNKQDLSGHRAGKLYFLPVTPLDISATKIREMVANQRNPAFLLPDSVLTYIKLHELYQSATIT
jgi:nicotinate-nucleotide adenylyltransferase